MAYFRVDMLLSSYRSYHTYWCV